MDRNLMLISRAREGDREAADCICRENMRLVQSIAARFIGRGTELSDLVQIGSVGLWKAVRGFDLSRGLKFSTYAVPMITGEIKRFLRDDGLVKVSRGLKERRLRALGVEEELRRSLSREPTVSEIAAKCGITVGELVEAYEACAPVGSIDIPAGEGMSTGGKIADTSQQARAENRVLASQLLSQLDPRERRVVMLRYGAEKTQSEIAEKIGVSQVHVSRIEKQALKKLRACLSE